MKERIWAIVMLGIVMIFCLSALYLLFLIADALLNYMRATPLN